MLLIKNKKPFLFILLFLLAGIFIFWNWKHSQPDSHLASNDVFFTEPDFTIESNFSSIQSDLEITTPSNTEHSSEEAIINEANYDPPIRDTSTEESTETTTHEPIDEFSPSQQTLLNVGLGNVVLLPTGDYGILMQTPNQTIEGKLGNEILRDYLSSLGLEGSIYGCWLNEDYYTFFAENIQKQISYDDEDFWD